MESPGTCTSVATSGLGTATHPAVSRGFGSLITPRRHLSFLLLLTAPGTLRLDGILRSCILATCTSCPWPFFCPMPAAARADPRLCMLCTEPNGQLAGKARGRLGPPRRGVGHPMCRCGCVRVCNSQYGCEPRFFRLVSRLFRVQERPPGHWPLESVLDSRTHDTHVRGLRCLQCAAPRRVV